MLHIIGSTGVAGGLPRWGESAVFIAMVLAPCGYALLLRALSAERR